MLDVLTFNGNGMYTLKEDNEKGRMETNFVSKAADGKQTVEITVSGDECIASRKMKLQFRNIEKGAVRVYENGALVSASVKMDGFVTVTLSDVKVGNVYTVEVEYTENEKYFQKRMTESLARIEYKTSGKDVLLRNAWQLSKQEMLDFVRNHEDLTENEKIYMTEEF